MNFTIRRRIIVRGNGNSKIVFGSKKIVLFSSDWQFVFIIRCILSYFYFYFTSKGSFSILLCLLSLIFIRNRLWKSQCFLLLVSQTFYEIINGDYFLSVLSFLVLAVFFINLKRLKNLRTFSEKQ